MAVLSTISIPATRRLVPPFTVTPFSECSVFPDLLSMDTGFASIAVATANLATYVPFSLDQPATVAQFFWGNGGAVAGATDVAVYDETAANKLATTGSTANATISVLQAVDITDVILPPGRYWLALACDNTGQSYLASNPAVQYLDLLGVKQQGTAFTLPATPTFATPTVGNIPIFGFTTRTVV